MVYADFGYYEGTYHGNSIAESDFMRLAQRAGERIDAMTFGRAEAYFSHSPAPIANATCAIAEILMQAERGNALLGGDGENARIQSEITGRYHRTHFATTDTSSTAGQTDINCAIRQAARIHLAITGLLYAGVS